jgi:hypothetical protein
LPFLDGFLPEIQIGTIPARLVGACDPNRRGIAMSSRNEFAAEHFQHPILRCRKGIPEKKEEIMKAFTRIGIVAGLVVLALLINPDVTRAQNYRGCAWPIEWSPEGFGNVIAPDSTARYWAMPFDNYETMTIKGTYPNARYFSIAAYKTNPDKTVLDLARAIHDAEIAPDPGSINPFVEPGGRNGTLYLSSISRTFQTEAQSTARGNASSR